MSLSNTLASLATLEATVAPVAIAAPVAPLISFRLWVSKEPRLEGLLTGDVYAPKSEGYVQALFAALESAGVNYRAPGFPSLIKVYSVGDRARVNIRTIGHPLSRIDGESITGWLKRVSFDKRTKGVAIEIPVKTATIEQGLTPAQVKYFHKSLGRHKFEKDALISDGLVHSFTFIAPPNLAPEVKQFTRTVEHLDAVPLPVLRVPANHVEPAAPIEHVEAVGDEPTFAIVEVDSLDAMAFSELKVLFKKEFRYNAPLNIRPDDLKMLINAKRDSAF